MRLGVEARVIHYSTVALDEGVSSSVNHVGSREGKGVNSKARSLYIDHDHGPGRDMIAFIFIVLSKLTRYT